MTQASKNWFSGRHKTKNELPTHKQLILDGRFVHSHRSSGGTRKPREQMRGRPMKDYTVAHQAPIAKDPRMGSRSGAAAAAWGDCRQKGIEIQGESSKVRRVRNEAGSQLTILIGCQEADERRG